MTHSIDSSEKIPLWRDERFWRIATQLIVAAIVIVIFAVLSGNLTHNLRQQGQRFDYGFLWGQAGFNIGESLVPYETGDRYYWALIVGLINTLRLILVGLIATTVLGIIAGIASFSENWLVRKLSLIYVEVVRNTPLLFQLFFWYFAVFFSLSKGSETTQLPGSIFISKKGLVIPWPPNTPIVWMWIVVLIVGSIAALLIWRSRIKLMEEQGASGKPQLITLSIMGIAALLILILGLGWDFPKLAAPGNVEGGLRLSLEYAAMLAGLAFYTGAFIAEIVRAGIQAVSKGQWEAAKALGLQPGLLMRLVVFPQALRVIIPSLNSQYMNLAKNSSLALAIGYPDFFSTSSTTLNQTGRSIEIVLIITVTYLIVDLIISVVMNLLNNTVQLKER
jgi:general L-amino acid transport system permease protein